MLAPGLSPLIFSLSFCFFALITKKASLDKSLKISILKFSKQVTNPWLITVLDISILEKMIDYTAINFLP